MTWVTLSVPVVPVTAKSAGATPVTASLKVARKTSVSALVGDPKAVGIYSLASLFQQVVTIPMRAYLDARFAEIGGSFPGPDNISDWKLGVTYTLDGWVFGLAYIDTNRSYTGGTAALTNRDIAGATGVLSVSKTF